MTRPDYPDILELWFFLVYFYCHKTKKIIWNLHCHLTKCSLHVIETKCIFMDVWIEDLFILLVKLHYFLPTRWQSLTSLLVILLYLSVFLSSFIHLISFVMMKAAASSPPHRLSSVYCEDIKEQTPDISILLLSFPQSFSQRLVEYCSANFTLLRMCLVFLLACLDHLSLLCMNLTVLKTVLSNVYISPL